jgi:periplasmic protein TonB
MFDPEISTMGLFLGIFLLIASILGIVIFFKRMMNNRSNADLTGLNKNIQHQSPMDARVKYPQVNAFKYSGSFFNFGLLGSITLIMLTLNWTVKEPPVIIPDGAMELDDDIIIEVPRTAEPPPPPPPPPPPVIEEVPEELAPEDPPELASMDVDVDDSIVVEEVEEAPPPPPPPAPKVEEIFSVVEQMPRFPSAECDAKSTQAEKDQCAQQEMLKYIYKNVKYPALARENNIEGRAIIQFVVEKDGSITDIKLARELQGGLGEEALRVVELMAKEKKWIPGMQRGKAVRVRFTLPIQFRLE